MYVFVCLFFQGDLLTVVTGCVSLRALTYSNNPAVPITTAVLGMTVTWLIASLPCAIRGHNGNRTVFFRPPVLAFDAYRDWFQRFHTSPTFAVFLHARALLIALSLGLKRYLWCGCVYAVSKSFVTKPETTPYCDLHRAHLKHRPKKTSRSFTYPSSRPLPCGPQRQQKITHTQPDVNPCLSRCHHFEQEQKK